ncbi:DUF4129 domain-containing protein [Nocardioides sp. zg-1228]|uniref:DUF4129 domain-containing protein n=1 Tax=Nocardioides sp. zg-1228 TaxID=2763008 RepID=UPI0016434A68|nr:DUF4129 domain-containing protein [Nocardioides sp. zg-1228]MBC2933909.1 DUF4129 domain-containing protein [Nocardioides sp. zg-1228]QSF58674.1 DUF4129 domain-containing protein [Nocardioides sp. zg-1228]
MRAPGLTPAVRATLAVALTCLLMVLVAWATLVGPDRVFTGPGPRPAPLSTTTESCIPLPVRTAPDGSTTVEVPDDLAERDYCDPPPAGLDDYREIVEDSPPPLWVKVLVWILLGALLAGVAAGVLGLLVVATRAVLARRGGAERIDVAFTALDEPDRVAQELAAGAEEQDALLRGGDPRNAIVAAWHRFEVLGERAGVARRASETSSEYALRILDLVDADTAPVNRLAELYREARFSRHPITEDHRAEAVAALAGIRRSLGVRT